MLAIVDMNDYLLASWICAYVLLVVNYAAIPVSS